MNSPVGFHQRQHLCYDLPLERPACRLFRYASWILETKFVSVWKDKNVIT